MRKLLKKITATWLFAFAIAGATVWAGAEEDAAEADMASAETGSAAAPAPHREADKA